MNILAIDTTSGTGSVALLRDAEVFAVIASTGGGPHSQRLFRDVDRLLRECGVPPPGIDLYAVATGPGSFTGVRVGVTAVKAWAEVYRKPVAGISALEAMASQSAMRGLVAGVADAHRGQFFAGLYETADGPLRRRGDDVVLAPAESLLYLAEQAAGEPFVIRTTAPDAVHAVLGGSAAAGATVETADPALAAAIGRLGHVRAQRGDVVDALTLDAHYVRRSDAELLSRGASEKLPADPVAVRRAESRDLDAIVAIEAEARPWAARWPRESYLATAASGDTATFTWVAEHAGEVAAFLLVRYAGGEMEILNLAVAGRARRRGIGRALVRAALADAATRGIARAFLEVRESNAPAIALYGALAFTSAGRRPGYYREPDEDGLILARPLPARTNPQISVAG